MYDLRIIVAFGDTHVTFRKALFSNLAAVSLNYRREAKVNSHDGLLQALGLLWQLFTKVVLFALFIPGMLVICLVGVGFHIQFSPTQFWVGALIANLGLLGVWSAFFNFSSFFDRIQTHFFIGLVVALVSVFAHFGLHVEFFSRVFQQLPFFEFGF